MADALILEFKGTVDQYQGVNKELGIDTTAGTGDWPAGMLSHVGAAGNGTIIVFEVWDTKASQETFMATRLGSALGKVGVAEPHRVEWLEVMGQGPA